MLDELGINLNANLVSAPGPRVPAAPAPAAAAAVPMAQPLGADAGARGGERAAVLRVRGQLDTPTSCNLL